MSTRNESVSGSVPDGVWIFGPWVDFLVGCGAWSAPLLAIATWLTAAHAHAWTVAFYLLAILFNYPHFMATIYRAYHARADFEKYKFFTLHVTLLMALTAVLLHASYRLLPWVFTLYICWSPWHYTGQNYGLLMMFVRRSGSEVTRGERRSIYGAFVASYLMLLASFETGGSTDPLIFSLGLPAQFTLMARLVLAAAFAAFCFLAFQRLIRRNGVGAMTLPLTLAVTQFLWFVLPTLLELHASYHVPQTRYSSGILAVLHSAQYLWITSYYQQREARAAGQSGWRTTAYFVTLVAGGIALFIPGPWLVSRVLHFDFTTSFLIFTAVVNIHHFILDGTLWKLRDSRIASLLTGRGGTAPGNEKRSEPAGGSTSAGAAPWLGSRILSAPAFRIGLAVLLFLWGGVDQIHFALGSAEGNASALRDAARLNPYDAMLQARIAMASAKAGQKDEEVAAFARAVDINPHNAALQHACARALIEDGRYEEAYQHYARMLTFFPRDADALVNYGLLAARLGHPDEAIDVWGKATEAAPEQPNPHLYLAEAFDQRQEPAAAARHWEAYLRFAAAHPDDPAAGPGPQISAMIHLADDDSRVHRVEAARAAYRSAIGLAERAGDARTESLALAHLADFEETTGDAKSAAQSYQRALALDAKAGEPRSVASDWFNYGQFLRRQKRPDELAYACYLQAESLLEAGGGPDLEIVKMKMARREAESRLGVKSAASRKNLEALLARATSLPANSF